MDGMIAGSVPARGKGLLVALVGAASSLTALAGAGEAQARPLDEIRESGELRVCVANANPPDGIIDPPGCRGDCGFGGVVGDLNRTFAQWLGLEARFWVSSWDELFHDSDGVTVKDASYTPASIATGRCDMIGSPLVRLEWRLKKLDMTCFLPSRMVVVVHEDRLGEFQIVEDLAGKTVTVEKNMSLHSWIEEQNATGFADEPVRVDFRPYEETIAAVDAGEADFTVVAVLDALWQTRHQLDHSVVAFAVGPTELGCWAYEQGAEALGAEIEAFFAQQQRDDDPALDRIWREYFGLSFAAFVRLVSTIQ